MDANTVIYTQAASFAKTREPASYYVSADDYGTWSKDKAKAKRFTPEAANAQIAFMRSRGGISIVLYGTEVA